MDLIMDQRMARGELRCDKGHTLVCLEHAVRRVSQVGCTTCQEWSDAYDHNCGSPDFARLLALKGYMDKVRARQAKEHGPLRWSVDEAGVTINGQGVPGVTAVQFEPGCTGDPRPDRADPSRAPVAAEGLESNAMGPPGGC